MHASRVPRCISCMHGESRIEYSVSHIFHDFFVRGSTRINCTPVLFTGTGTRVTNDHGCCSVAGILANFLPNNENQSIAGCSVFGFAGGEIFLGFGACGRDQGLWSRPGPSVATKARHTQVAHHGVDGGLGYDHNIR